MVGNDVVDLRDPETLAAALHPRFDERVFAPPERAMLDRSAAPARLRWLLWAAKEAAYKLARKLDAGVSFSPSRFLVHLDAAMRGTVTHQGRTLAVFIGSEPDSVHAIATCSAEGAGRVLSAVAPVPDARDASQGARQLAIRVLSSRLGVPAEQLAVGRCGRAPRLLFRGEPSAVDLSLSHHGGLVAFACDPEGSPW